MSTTNACPLCGGLKETGTTTFTADLTFGVVVRDVPSQVCSQCGEAWIEDDVAAALEDIVAEARARQAVVEVTRRVTRRCDLIRPRRILRLRGAP